MHGAILNRREMSPSWLGARHLLKHKPQGWSFRLITPDSSFPFTYVHYRRPEGPNRCVRRLQLQRLDVCCSCGARPHWLLLRHALRIPSWEHSGSDASDAKEMEGGMHYQSPESKGRPLRGRSVCCNQHGQQRPSNSVPRALRLPFGD
jgi:hypothetical protein